MAARSFGLVGSRDQWLRCSHEGTHLDADGVVGLAWTEPAAEAPTGEEAGGVPGGMTFDSACRLYRTVPSEGQVSRHPWRESETRGRAAGPGGRAVPLFDRPPTRPVGDFSPVDEEAGALLEPRAVVVDPSDRLFVAETGAGRVVVYDLWSRTLVRRIPIPGDAPVDLVLRGTTVLVLGREGTVTEITARHSDRVVSVADAGSVEPPRTPGRLAVSPSDEVLILDGTGTESARVVFLEWDASPAPGSGPGLFPARELPVPGATDLAFDGEGRLVVARRAGDVFRRFDFVDGLPVESRPLRARGYDGFGIVATPDGRVGFWTGSAFGVAAPASVRYRRRGRVTTLRLDGEDWGARWGRLFLDACVPEGCRIRVHLAAADEPPDEPRLPRIPPAGVPVPPPLDGESPPMPPVSLVPGEHEVRQPLHRREEGRELPWSDPPPDAAFHTWEAPGPDGPGRYLWVTLELVGTTRRTPRVRSLRVERPGHDLLRRLPRVFSKNDAAESFLRKYLTPVDGFLTELDAGGISRHSLVLPRSTPEELLPWLAGFLGLVLDERWPEETRRRILDETPWLFRFRGTVPGLRRFLALYAGEPVVVLEHFRLRGLGGSVLGDTGAAFSSSVVGGGFRVGGRVGEESPRPLEGTTEDAFRSHAHRFTVLLGRSLTEEELGVVNRILELHRPAHTVVDVCTVDAGMRVGRGLHLGLSSLIGRTGGFETARLGASLVGRRAVLGRPGPGTRVGAAHMGQSTEVG